MNYIKNLSILLLVSILSFEVLSFLATKLNLFLVNDTPSLYAREVNAEYQDIAYGRTERDKWGAWHASGVFRDKKSCFNVKMSFNEIGARDESFYDVPSSSLFLLGDSFAEGLGVAREDISEFLIEKNLKLSILNFGTAGNFGPLQQLLIYDEFYELPHQGVIIYILPANDFTDNDVEIWQAIDQSRYRPYFSSEGDPLVPYYFPNAVPRDSFATGVSGGLKQFIKSNFWFSNALRSALMMMRGETYILSKHNDYTPSFYYDSTELQQSNLILAYEAILDLATDKNILFVIIPDSNDIKRYNENPVPDSYKESFWYQRLFSFQDRSSQRVEILDLMDYIPSEHQSLFLECDGHWSPKGNLWAANVVSHFIRDQNLFVINE